MLSLKSIISANIDGTPLFSSNLKSRLNEYKKYIKENIHEANNKEEELEILCIHGLYGYRSGLIGFLSNYLTYNFINCKNVNGLQRFLNFLGKNNYKIESTNDFEIIAFILSLISRTIPILNIGNWDPKKNFFRKNSFFKNVTTNLSKPSIFNLKSIYLLDPIFDCGSAIYANKKPIDRGYEKWNLDNRIFFNEKVFNKGILWSYFESKDKKNGITIININVINNVPDILIDFQLNQLIELKERIKNKYINNLDKYETFITGNFNIELNLINENETRFNIFKDSNLQIINNRENIINTHFILYSNNLNTTPDIEVSLNNKIENDDFLNINFKMPIKNDEVIINIDPKIEIESKTKITDKKIEPEEIKNIIDVNINNDYFGKTETNENSPSNKDNEWIEI